MDEVHAVVRRAVIRLSLLNAARWFVVCLCCGLGLVGLLRVVEQGFGLSFGWGFDGLWGGLLLWVGVGVFVGTVVFGILTRPGRLEAARVVDEGAGLRESLSTAVGLVGDDDPWSVAAVEQARERARGVRVSSAVPARAPAGWPVAVAMVLGLAVVWVVSPWLGRLPWSRERVLDTEPAAALVQARMDVAESLDAVAEALRRMDEGLGEDLLKDELLRGDEAGRADPDEIRRAAIRRLTDLRDRVEDQSLRGEAGRRADALRNQLEMLRDPKPGPMSEMSRMLSRGDFEGAKRALEEVMEKISDGSMSDEDFERMKEQLEDLAEQLAKLSENQRQLERELERSGLDPALAKDLEALSEAIQNNPNLSEAQKEALQRAAEAQKSACEACAGLGAAVGQMASKFGKSGASGSQGMSADAMGACMNFGDQLSMAEMMRLDAQAASAALASIDQQLQKLGSQCQGGQCASGSCGGMGAMSGLGGGGGGGTHGGGAGSGLAMKKGPGARAPEDAYDTAQVRSPSQQLGGPIVGSMLIEGDSIRGESVAEFRSVAAAAGERAAEAMETNAIPREFHGAIKHYFGSLTRTGGESGGDGGGSGDGGGGE